ncbi:uncharacterized protein [Penaeus vannamei]|uniref:uncharacterized protein n=1 Tax=Penaeus vannamei TaxID=6689 RepID=UPI00387F805C
MLAQSVLVTGCSRGIGLEFVRQLVSCDKPPAVVIGTCRNPDKAEELQQLAKKYSNLKIIKFDVVDYASLPRVVEEVGRAVGRDSLRGNKAGHGQVPSPDGSAALSRQAFATSG